MTKTNLSTLIDDLGTLKAVIANLLIEEKALKEALADLAPGNYEGEQFRLSVSVTERDTLDMAAVRDASVAASSLPPTPIRSKSAPCGWRRVPARRWRPEPSRFDDVTIFDRSYLKCVAPANALGGGFSMP